MTKPIRKAVFPVGGLGTRFLPATKAMPKEMLPVVDKPIIQYAVEEARAAGVEEFIFVTGRGKSAMEDHFDISYELEATLAARGKTEALEEVRRWMPPEGAVSYVRQQAPLGLGHAVYCARNLVGDEPFIVVLPDDVIMADTPCLKQMVEARRPEGGNMVATMEVPQEHTSRYGVISPGESQGRMTEIKGLVEKPDPAKAPSRLAVIGRYILEPEVFEHLERRETGAGGEIQLTDALARMIGNKPFDGYRFEGKRFDCGDKIGFLHATVAFALAREDMAGSFTPILKDIVSKL
ncbi:UTP--glucose-1-phosphate uridylyltransferase GalU [Oceanibacterium hippocampi]|uniref:UTP--glucose-1-phosphate uridylyltransferase n=1 Tax=Oceanibacterium hippocampi TaxID=745714 RepID=A0A1Y5SK68_9PROT|nr:UTP--glucose-1-phosphate uridylyltransferase GalU [Oceanibacterium hippocampi]SLN41503.1 UTP--glucose-1-phosphate uridylyltransferase [Oceanibacterium hippocampi]